MNHFLSFLRISLNTISYMCHCVCVHSYKHIPAWHIKITFIILRISTFSIHTHTQRMVTDQSLLLNQGQTSSWKNLPLTACSQPTSPRQVSLRVPQCWTVVARSLLHFLQAHLCEPGRMGSRTLPSSCPHPQVESSHAQTGMSCRHFPADVKPTKLCICAIRTSHGCSLQQYV